MVARPDFARLQAHWYLGGHRPGRRPPFPGWPVAQTTQRLGCNSAVPTVSKPDRFLEQPGGPLPNPNRPSLPRGWSNAGLLRHQPATRPTVQQRRCLVRWLPVGGWRPGEQAELAGVGDRLGPGRDLELAIDGL